MYVRSRYFALIKSGHTLKNGKVFNYRRQDNFYFLVFSFLVLHTHVCVCLIIVYLRLFCILDWQSALTTQTYIGCFLYALKTHLYTHSLWIYELQTTIHEVNKTTGRNVYAFYLRLRKIYSWCCFFFVFLLKMMMLTKNQFGFVLFLIFIEVLRNTLFIHSFFCWRYLKWWTIQIECKKNTLSA